MCGFGLGLGLGFGFGLGWVILDCEEELGGLWIRYAFLLSHILSTSPHVELLI